MSITKLFLFAKDTDAPATEQGFYYQKLKTLQTWLQNRLKEVDDVIYCDNEEDIFERNTDAGTAKFRQVKLYSTNFSFAKEEIEKSLSHFFMLFVKGDYLFDNAIFWFETNASVAKETRGNNASLLREWWQNQENLSEELLSRIKIRVKTIIDEYINQQLHNTENEDENAALQEAVSVYKQLPEETWDLFIQSIKWSFEGISQEKAIADLIKDCERLIRQLPLPINPERASSYLSGLHFEIAQRTASKIEEERMLTNALLDDLILRKGSDADQWYAAVLAKWREIDQIEHFHIGAFYEVVNAARHCRWHISSPQHRQQWLWLLKLYIDQPDIFPALKTKAIYEYLFLRVSPDPETFEPKDSLAEESHYITDYFENFADPSFQGLEEVISILSIAKTANQTQAMSTGEGFLSNENLSRWSLEIAELIDAKITAATKVDELCEGLELKGTYLYQGDFSQNLPERIIASVDTYRQIIPHLKNTRTYSISRLSEILNQIVKMQIAFGDELAAGTAEIETFLQEIETYAGRTGQQHTLAHNHVERGRAYIMKPSSANYLKALDCFHKAKNLWFLNDTSKGYVLALMNIAHIYDLLGMHLAAKYHGLCGVWAVFHLANEASLELVTQSYALVFDADFHQGAWISALDDYKEYLKARVIFQTDPLNGEDNLFKKITADLAVILSAAPMFHPSISGYIDYQKKLLGPVYDQYAGSLVQTLKKEMEKLGVLNEIVTRRVNGIPLNDVGPQRKISFRALGIDWIVSFDNTPQLNAIAEEFCAHLQIILCEVGLSGADYLLLQLPVTIYVTESKEVCKWIEQRPDHNFSEWDLALPSFSSKDPIAATQHHALVITNIRTLLSHLSVLPTTEFNQHFQHLLERQTLIEKGIGVNTYQRIYHNLSTPEIFSESQRTHFLPAPLDGFIHNSANFLPIPDQLSIKYNHVTSVTYIEERYENLARLLSVSLTKWKEDPDFRSLINELRTAEWLDWQILMAIMNYVISAKVEWYMEKVTETDPVKRTALIRQENQRLMSLDERECYMEIPVSWLRSELFNFYLNKTPVDTLKSFELENGMKHPNWAAVRVLLNKKFNFDKDDAVNKSPLKDI